MFVAATRGKRTPTGARGMNWRRLFAIVVKELRQLRRDRITLAMIVGIPVMQLVLFGYAINLNLRGLSAGVADQANTAGSRALVMDMVATGVIEPTRERAHAAGTDGAAAARRDQRRHRDPAGFRAPPHRRPRGGAGAGRRQRHGGAERGDPAGADAAGHARPAAQAARSPTSGQISVVSFYNPERRSAVNIVPGLIGVILTMTMVLFTGVAIVRERERGNMELLIATPVSRAELMIGKVLPYAAIGLVQTTVVLALGVWLFDVPIRGSVLDVYLAAVLLILANLTLGLLISTKAQSQFQAMQMTFFVFLPSILLSGFMFPFAGMPQVVQWLAEVLPLTHFLRLIRGVMLRGAGLSELWPDVLALLAFTAVMMTLAILRFRKRLD